VSGSRAPASEERQEPVGDASSERPIVAGYSYGLCAGAVVLLGAAALRGSPFPPWWPLLVLAISMWLAANRFAFFPSEFAVTAEPAVVFVAVVGLAGGAWLLGPVLVAMLVGPLDRVIWERRSFVRMAYNSGWQGIAAAVTAIVFREATVMFGSSKLGTIAAVLVAAVPYVALESVFATVLLALRREPHAGTVARHLIALSTLDFAFALYAGAVGLLVLAYGWWLALVLLAPLPFVPELVFVRVRRSWCPEVARHAWRAALLVGVIVVTAARSPWSRVADLAILFALAILLGAELRVMPRAPVAALTVLAVAVGASAFAGADAVGVSVAVAIVVVLASWSPDSRLPRRAPMVAIALGAVAAMTIDASSVSSRAGLVVAGFAGTAAGVAVVVVSTPGPRAPVAWSAAWCAPLFAAATLAGVAW
jgi:hypothetical protein